MDWHQISIAVITVIVLLWGGWKLAKRIPREIGEAFLEIANAIEDDKVTRAELKRIMVRFTKILDILRQIKPGKATCPAIAGWLIHWLVYLFKPMGECPPPASLGKITNKDIGRALKEAGVIGRYTYLGFVDRDYEVTSKSEYERFLKWYHDKYRYSWDDYDCDDFAWLMRAQALKWMRGKFPFGYIEAEGVDVEYMFPMHAFCFIIDEHKQIYFCDELNVAAPRDKFMPSYVVKTFCIKV